MTPGKRAGGGKPEPEEQKANRVDRFNLGARRVIPGEGIFGVVAPLSPRERVGVRVKSVEGA
jgi:hypothetical protein